jgi:hypothetical protein
VARATKGRRAAHAAVPPRLPKRCRRFAGDADAGPATGSVNAGAPGVDLLLGSQPVVEFVARLEAARFGDVEGCDRDLRLALGRDALRWHRLADRRLVVTGDLIRKCVHGRFTLLGNELKVPAARFLAATGS